MTEQNIVGTPHVDPPEADVFTGTTPAADVGEPGDLGAQIGVPSSGEQVGYPHEDPSTPNVFTGTNPAGDIGEPA